MRHGNSNKRRAMYVRLVSIDDRLPAIGLCIGGTGSALPRFKHGYHYGGGVVCILSHGIERSEFLFGVGNFAVDGLEGIHEDPSLSIAWGMAIGRGGG